MSYLITYDCYLVNLDGFISLHLRLWPQALLSQVLWLKQLAIPFCKATVVTNRMVKQFFSICWKLQNFFSVKHYFQNIFTVDYLYWDYSCYSWNSCWVLLTSNDLRNYLDSSGFTSNTSKWQRWLTQWGSNLLHYRSFPKRVVLSLTLNYIWWWGYISGALRSVRYSFMLLFSFMGQLALNKLIFRYKISLDKLTCH